MVSREIWKNSFGDWFRNIIDEAGILDYRYPVKGFGVWLAYGFKLRNHVLKKIRKLLDETGHEEMLFPTLIPEDLIVKESTHIRSFEGEAYWVTHGGETQLAVRLMLRPTSETIITPMVKLWVRSHADLPKRVYQIAPIFRYETKATRPLIRIREVTTFKEAHTFHASHDEALTQVRLANEIYAKIFDELCVPFIFSKRPEWDKFAGAESTYAFDTVFPDGRALQIGTTHDLGQNFSRAFDFKFETKDGQQVFVWQTSYGISERAIASLIAIHGDDRGLVLPPQVAPVQVVIIPIPYRGVEESIEKVCTEVKKVLEEGGFRVEYDKRQDATPGSKYYHWEQKGVPIRVEVGPRDVERGQVTIVRRDTSYKATCERESVLENVRNICLEISSSLRERAWKWLKSNIHKAKDAVDAKMIIDSSGGVVEIPWCGNDECGIQMEKEVDARILGLPDYSEVKISGTCPICNGPGKYVIRAARAY